MCCPKSILFSFIAALAMVVSSRAAPPDSNAVTYRGKTYLAFDVLKELLQGKSELTAYARGLRISAKDKTWEFLNGGDRLKDPSGKVRLLDRPLLVIGGKHFVPLQECATTFGYTVRKKPQPTVTLDGQIVGVKSVAVDSAYQNHVVDQYAVEHTPVVLTEPVQARTSLHAKSDVLTLKVGSVLLIRRKVSVDGSACLIATDCERSLVSYLFDEDELRKKSSEGDLTKTTWAGYRRWFEKQAVKKQALRFGPRANLEKCVGVTVDLCWSLRPFEEKFFFTTMPNVARNQDRSVSPVLFVSGRWLEQHPTEMHRLIELGRRPRIDLVWGLHSWVHPKSDGFMNDLAPDEVRADTLRLEKRMLEYGIIPTVYYRFPGLIHDEVRLKEILKLDLYPIDCDSWIAWTGGRGPFHQSVQGGSIILVHGNGNEPKGIVRMHDWLEKHADWTWSPIHCFFKSATKD